MIKRHKKLNQIICAFAAFLWLSSVGSAQTLDFETPEFKLRLVESWQTVAALEPKSAPGFDFTPADRFSAMNGYHHLGDWQSFGGNISVSGNWVNVQPLDSFRQRVYIAPLGLWLTLAAGTFERIAINTKTQMVRVMLSPADRYTPNARLRLRQPARIASVGAYAPRQNFVNERDTFTIPLGRSATEIQLVHKKHK